MGDLVGTALMLIGAFLIGWDRGYIAAFKDVDQGKLAKLIRLPF